MINLCCGRPLPEALKYFALVDLVFDNVQVAVLFICFAFPEWLPEEYYKYKVNTLKATFENSTVPAIHKPQEDPRNPAEGESDFILFLAAIGLMVCIGCILSLFTWLWTGAKDVDVSKCKKWLCVRVLFFSFLVLVTIYKVATQNYYGFDVILDLMKIYSIYEIFVVKKFIDTYSTDTPILVLK